MMRWEIPVWKIPSSPNSCLSDPVYFPRLQLSFHSQKLGFQVNIELQARLSLNEFNQKVLVRYSNMHVCTGWGS